MMLKRREKGKIPHSEWPAIRTRYDAGESLASIARDYACTGPAIRYIVNRPQAGGTPAERDEGGEPSRQAAPDNFVPEMSRRSSSDRLDAMGIDPDLRWRVSSEIASFLAVFDTFLTDASSESYEQLLTATDRLMRAAARTRIELERMRTESHPRLPQANPMTSARSRTLAT